jgi:hypothetical protein
MGTLLLVNWGFKKVWVNQSIPIISPTIPAEVGLSFVFGGYPVVIQRSKVENHHFYIFFACKSLFLSSIKKNGPWLPVRKALVIATLMGHGIR